MIRSLIFLVVIVLSVAAGYYLPPPSAPAPMAAVVPQVRTVVAPRTTASATKARADARSAARLQAQQAHEEEEKRLTQLERGYAIMTDAEDRTNIIDGISDLETSAVVPALGRLFAIEADPALKEALIEAVGWGETTDEAKAAVYAAALASDQPAKVRLAAIDGLADLDSKAALPLLRPLAEEADQEVRAAALETIRGFENP